MTQTMGIQTERRGAVLVVTIDRAARKNSLDNEALHGLADALDTAERDGVRALVLRGAEGTFCAGSDLKELVQGVEYRRSHTKPLGVKEIRFQDEFGGEETAGTAHENDQNCQNQASDHDRYSNLQFRPFQLLLARQLSSQAEWRRISMPLTTGATRRFS